MYGTWPGGGRERLAAPCSHGPMCWVCGSRRLGCYMEAGGKMVHGQGGWGH